MPNEQFYTDAARSLDLALFIAFSGGIRHRVGPYRMQKFNLRRSWYDYNWDWALISLLALVILFGIVLWITYTDRSQTAALSDDSTTGQNTRPSRPTFPN
jgi:hypothetical protein